ncbi:MAG: type II secretion system GspH family protein [Planctomycetales bacterium]|nr:type II secretion system GspH family protein [Planctomycetales bacterium]
MRNIQYKIYNIQSRGFTLLEATFAMVVLAIAAAGILLPFASAASVQVEAARQTTAANLASELVEKVITTSHGAIISTYNSYNESDGALRDTAGNLYTGSNYAGFSRSVTCHPVTVGSVGLIRVTVVVLYENVPMTRITTLVGNHE